MKPTVGRIVYFSDKDRNGKDVIRPAIVVAVWNDELLNLQVFTDGYNDNEYGVNVKWVTSVHRSENGEYRTWDWMPYQKEQAKKHENEEKDK